MHDAFRGGWPHRHPPNTSFELNWRSPQANGLVGWWPTIASNGSLTLRDLRGRHHGVISGADWAVRGETGPALDFVNANDGVSIANNFSGNKRTWTAWIYPRDWGQDSTFGMILSDYFGGGGTGSGWYLRAASTGMAIYPGGGFSDAGVISLNTLQHVSVAMDGTNAYFYTNGVPVGSIPHNQTSDTPIEIGIENNAFDFDGFISDVRVYNRALSQAEILTQWNPATRWELYAPRVRFWPTEEGVCTTTVTVTETATVTVTAQQ